MTWLKYTDDEVFRFHPEFHSIADDVLRQLGKDSQYHWKHHPYTTGARVVPDFVLVETATNRWWLVVEVKRSRSSVFSERSQIQAKGYAETNQSLYPPIQARYFCATNLEVTLLFALNGTNPVRECRVKDLDFDSGNFTATPEAVHKAKLAADLQTLIDYVLTTPVPIFDSVWPRIARTLLSHATSLTYDPKINLRTEHLPAVVSDYFAGAIDEVPKRELLLRCLVAEYLKGILAKHGHSRSTTLPPLRNTIGGAAGVIDVLRTIDFSGIFEASAPSLYRSLVGLPSLKVKVEHYLQDLINERVDRLALRNDALEFPEVLIAEAYPQNIQNARGKAQTDPDLAALLSTLTIDSVDSVIIDPGCGDGSLLSAAYDTLKNYGASHAAALGRLKGLDADAFATKVAALRLALKAPYMVHVSDPNHVVPGDMFSSASVFAEANVVLMNPPFKRYEAQDAAPIPLVLRKHYRSSIEMLPSTVETDVGQANIYNLYVEFVVKVSSPNTVFGIILDNRWYHNKASSMLRTLLLRDCEVLAVIGYPHDLYFDDLMIATSILVARKKAPSAGHKVDFVRTHDPRRSDFNLVALALRNGSAYPLDWYVNKVDQSILDSESWQQYFSKALTEDFRVGLPSLDGLFQFSRRGSLAKEGGGIAVYEFPIGRTKYGPQRLAKPAPRNKFQTRSGRSLDPAENERLRVAAGALPATLRGYAVQNSDQLTAYKLTVSDVTRDETIEAPAQRAPSVFQSYWSKERRAWDAILDAAVDQIRTDPHGATYTDLVRQLVKLDETVLSRAELWNALREPFAGELIIPRKLRAGHRVHINPFAYAVAGRQVRLSSNFFSYSQCTALDVATGLTRDVAVELIAAFLLSSFGQVQFEMEAYNREGARSIEQHQLQKIRVFDPRYVRPASRAAIQAAASALPYPVPTDRDPRTLPPLQALDELFADEIVYRTPSLNKAAMLEEVWQTLAEWLLARRP